MTKNYLITIKMFLAGTLGLYGCVPDQNTEEDILRRLVSQTVCWNTGDLDCFMMGYWQSDSLMFISKDQVIYGYENTLMRYQSKYPDEAAMGKLKFDIQHINKISDNAYFVVGRYHLSRDQNIGNAEGNFSLLWKKINGEWVIVADHTS